MDIREISVSASNSMTRRVEKENREAQSTEFSQILSAKIQDDKKLLEACQMLESFFVKEVLKSAESTNFSSDENFMSAGSAEKTFKDMLNDEYAQMMAKGRGIGIAEMLYRQLKK